ncbi:RNA polymerase sigma factor [Gryllotalpicola reticulitermitis]|uniref:RNA polymerase sigma factor n=1 Tax=Gryllotalpicola reticulitermitis TaxID=1184153 RepID=A0ABV8Q2L4_9MICO
MNSDSEIVLRSLSEPAVFGALYERYADLVYRYTTSRVGQTFADDVTSETFLVAFQRRRAFDPERGQVSAWLMGIATTLMKKHAREEARTIRSAAAELAAASVPTDVFEQLGTRLDAAALVGRIADALARLPAKYRDVLLLHAWADLDYPGIAQALDIPVGTVASRLNRARTTLRAVAEAGSPRDAEVEHGRVDARAQHAQ